MTGTHLLPLSDVIAPARAQHRSLLADLAAWSLANGTSVDLDIAALHLSASDRRGGILLTLPCTRPNVNHLLGGVVSNWCTMHTCERPPDAAEHLWSLLHFLHDRGLLAAGSDPLPALLEPLQCSGDLGPDGRPSLGRRPDFACQCFLPVVKPSAPGLTQWSTPGQVIIELRRPAQSDAELASDYHPLARLNSVLRDEDVVDGHHTLHIEDFKFVGTAEPGLGWPRLWLYTALRWHGDVLVGEDGGGHELVIDGRRKRGYRFAACSAVHAAHRSGSFRQPARGRRNGRNNSESGTEDGAAYGLDYGYEDGPQDDIDDYVLQ